MPLRTSSLSGLITPGTKTCTRDVLKSGGVYLDGLTVRVLSYIKYVLFNLRCINGIDTPLKADNEIPVCFICFIAVAILP